MRLLHLTCRTPEENLALDEALLEEAEQSDAPRETLRLWEPASNMVVVGRSSHITQEVQIEFCRAHSIPVLRRPSGGAAVVAGPGCLMYALVLSYQRRPALRMISLAHRFVLQTIADALRPRVPGVACQGTSDLVLGADDDRCPADSPADSVERLRKFSGNSVRCRRSHLLYHGTLLYDFPLELIGQCLTMPPHQPVYRAGRGHGAFVANLPLDAKTLANLLIDVWNATAPCENWPQELTARLVQEKYATAQWNA